MQEPSVRDELSQMRHTREQLRRAAQFFERYGNGCTGECAEPRQIAKCLFSNECLTCCNLFPTFVRYMDMRKTEKYMRGKANIGRPLAEKASARPVEAPLGERYERTFTDTGVHRRAFKVKP